MATGPFRCSISSCAYDAGCDSGHIMCPEHWSLLPVERRQALARAQGTQRWLPLAREAATFVHQRQEQKAMLEDSGFSLQALRMDSVEVAA